MKIRFIPSSDKILLRNTIDKLMYVTVTVTATVTASPSRCYLETRSIVNVRKIFEMNK